MDLTLINDLIVDRTISEGQLQRHYNLDLSDIQFGHIVEVFLSKTQHSLHSEKYWFLVAEKHDAHLRDFQLRHLAGITEIRHQLGASINNWSNRAASTKGIKYPDGVWLENDRSIAIEYDTSSYSKSQLLEKVIRYHGNYGLQIWGTSSETRQNRVEGLLVKWNCPGRVLLSRWW